MVIKTNTGLSTLVYNTRAVLSNCEDTSVYDSWHGRRWSFVEKRLAELSSDQEVDSFISSYADSLAHELLSLLGPSESVYPAETAAAAAEYFEELLTQAKFMAESVESDRPEQGDQLPDSIGGGSL